MRLGLLAAVALALQSCAPRPAPPPVMPHYVVGGAYQSGGAWQYPHEQFQLDTTGIADIMDASGLAADGEPWEGMVAAHGTLQLPCIVTVTNLETGLQVRLRVIGHGPPGVHRLLGVSRRAGTLLGMTGPTRIRLQVEDEPSQALRERLLGGPAAAFRAPRVAVLAEPLAAPGVPASLRPAPAPPRPEPAATVPEPRLPEEAERVPASPGTLWIDAGHFTGAAAADTQARRLTDIGGRAERSGTGRNQSFRVRAGPFADVAQADSALDRALLAGVTDARIVVE